VNEPRSAWLAIVGRFETGFSRLGHYPRQRLDDCEVRQEFWRNVVPPYLIGRQQLAAPGDQARDAARG